jgi:hypothetical protein
MENLLLKLTSLVTHTQKDIFSFPKVIVPPLASFRLPSGQIVEDQSFLDRHIGIPPAQVKQTMCRDFHFLMIFLKIVTSNELFGLTFWCLGFLWTEKLKPNYKGKKIFMGRSQFCFIFFGLVSSSFSFTLQHFFFFHLISFFPFIISISFIFFLSPNSLFHFFTFSFFLTLYQVNVFDFLSFSQFPLSILFTF